jgi:small Trp-rich protein
MIFLVLGVALLVMKFAEFGPVADWPWWVVLMPFVATLLWWWYSDASGLNKRREMDRMEDRKSERRHGLLARLGLKDRYRRRSKASKQADRAHAARQRQIDKIEGKRADQRARHRDSILRSRFDAEQSITRPSQISAMRGAGKAAQPGKSATSTARQTSSAGSTSGGPGLGGEAGDLSSVRVSGFAETVPAQPSQKPK